MHGVIYALSLTAASWSVCRASPLHPRAMVVHERLTTVPAGFTQHNGALSLEEELTLRIALTPGDMQGLEARTYEVSDPASAKYGQHLAVDEVASYVAPTPEALSAVSSWLSAANISTRSISPAGDLLQISLPVQTADELFATSFDAFSHQASGRRVVRALEYSVPAAVKEYIQFVHPVVSFPAPPPPTLAQRAKITTITTDVRLPSNGSCGTTVTPSCLQEIYKIPKKRATSSGNGIAVAGYANQYANFKDLSKFITQMRPDLGPNANFTVDMIDGGANEQLMGEAGDEADLDIQYTVGVASGVPVTFVSVGFDFSDEVDGFIDIVNHIIGMSAETRPTVLSTSFGFNEDQFSRSISIGICNAYTQLAAMGISALFATGDGGVGGFGQSDTCTEFVPTTPASCPFVTSVGGSTTGKTAASLSSGGFSNYFATPEYQLDDVRGYISGLGTQFTGMYNQSGRGFPDVAAQAANVEIVWKNQSLPVGGTSCATPIFASIIALVNDRLLAAGKPVLGFLNPLLYSPAGRAAFVDITQGSNPGCNTTGFAATQGWDPVTGLGTPDFELLLSAVGVS
ncbi:family S53 protease [Roridomyces roridus]|uniref:tripeptidyl-peptidase II n=1 Tax=Roridomyces roridus TaxID=1738132 RepID=A0AAD7FLV8_9AGAR|nr:family S53 protease [Roridomyces roridus]